MSQGYKSWTGNGTSLARCWCCLSAQSWGEGELDFVASTAIPPWLRAQKASVSLKAFLRSSQESVFTRGRGWHLGKLKCVEFCIYPICHCSLPVNRAALLAKSDLGLGSTACRAPQCYIPHCLRPGPCANSLVMKWGWDHSSVLLRNQRRSSKTAQVVFNEYIIKPGKIQFSPCCMSRELNATEKAPALKLRLQLLCSRCTCVRCFRASVQSLCDKAHGTTRAQTAWS